MSKNEREREHILVLSELNISSELYFLLVGSVHIATKAIALPGDRFVEDAIIFTLSSDKNQRIESLSRSLSLSVNKR